MKKTIHKCIQTFDRYPLLLRVLILSGILSAVFWIWYLACWSRLKAELSSTSKKINTIQVILPSLEQRLLSLEKNPNQQTENDRQLKKRDPKSTLISLMSLNHNLSLLEFQGSSMDDTDPNKKLGSTGLVVRFTGDYFSTMDYLRSMEDSPLEIFWDKLDYRVINYPLAEISMHLHLMNNL